MSHDPAVTDPDLYKVVFENDRVRVLEYRDRPGDQTHPHRHPDSVMLTLGSFRRRLLHDGRQVDVELPAGEVRWLDAQEHAGRNIGDTGSHSIFVELKEPAPGGGAGPSGRPGPSTT
jgi:beta-alanine degradation protein BauB